MSRYTTHNIDEATYLVMKGLKYKGQKLGIVSSNYTFEWTSQLERYRKEFWGKMLFQRYSIILSNICGFLSILAIF